MRLENGKLGAHGPYKQQASPDTLWCLKGIVLILEFHRHTQPVYHCEQLIREEALQGEV